MLPTKAELNTHTTDLINKLINYAKIRFDVDVSNIVLKVGFKEYLCPGTAGRLNGKPYMKLNLGDLLKYPVAGFNEYKSFAASSVIGAFYTTNWRRYLSALIIHEFAHVIQYALPESRSQLRVKNDYYTGLGTFEGNHGNFFKRIYAVIRNEFLETDITLAYKQVVPFPDKPKHGRTVVLVDHDFIGKKVMVKGWTGVIIGYKPRNHKYPFLVSVQNSPYKLSERYVRANMIKD